MRRTIALLTVAMLIAMVVSACSKPLEKMTAIELLDLGEKYLLEMNYEEAILCFNRLIEIEPRNAAAYIGLANALVGNGETEKAAEVLQTGIDCGAEQEALSNLMEQIVPPESHDAPSTPIMAPSFTPTATSTPSVEPPQQPEALAFEWTYSRVYGWINIGDSFNRENIAVIVIFPDLTLEMTTNEFEYMDIFSGRAELEDDGYSYKCIFDDGSFTLLYQGDNIWAIKDCGWLCTLPEDGDLYTACDVKEALERIDIIKNTVTGHI